MNASPLRFDGTSLAEAQFSDVDLWPAPFMDVNLSDSRFLNVSFAGAVFEYVDMSNFAVTNANLEGITINDVLVTELLHAYDA